jgi:hypothetical protein
MVCYGRLRTRHGDVAYVGYTVHVTYVGDTVAWRGTFLLSR